MTVLVGGVYELFQGDLDLGRLAAERLRVRDLGRDVLVEDLHYGAVAVCQRLDDLRPALLLVVAAVQRGRVPGTVERRRVDRLQMTPADVQAAVGDAVTGYVHVDLLVEVATGLGVLPPRTVVVEVEPASVAPGEGLTPPAAAALDAAVELAAAEARRAPLLALADEIRVLLADGRLEHSAALAALRGLLEELRLLDREGRWGAAFAERNRLRLGIASGGSSGGMDHRDWGLWWALVEELDRLEALEARLQV